MAHPRAFHCKSSYYLTSKWLSFLKICDAKCARYGVYLLQAAAAMRRPCYPIVTPQGRILSFERLESSAQAFDLSNEPARRGPGFSYLNLLGLDSNYVDPFHDLADFSAILHASHEGLLYQPLITRIADSRNVLQHRLLSLPSAEELVKMQELDSTGAKHF